MRGEYPPKPERKHSVFNVCGIYFLYNDDELLYIGKSRNVMLRISQHTRDKQLTSYSYIEMSDDEYALMQAEIHYIRKYRPSLNEIYMSGLEREPETVLIDDNLDMSNRILSGIKPSGRAAPPAPGFPDSVVRKVKDSPLADYYWANRLNTRESIIQSIRAD